ncbi:hypothetical protein B0H14DRAFT_2628361 [Mycena olivaceomarginata]|nr:hypothetical protein B0H14DRAFT_2628361 [Mycena olivaceomarginata]
MAREIPGKQLARSHKLANIYIYISPATGVAGTLGDDASVGKGGKGGNGDAPKLQYQLVPLRPDWRTLFKLNPKMSIDQFCRDHYLGQEILGLLKQCKFESPRSLLVAEEPTLVAKRFKIGHIAELKWALKRMVGKELLMDDDNAAGVVVYGGMGGEGGYGGERGGQGGLGEGPVLSLSVRDKKLIVGGGIGGQGGPGGVRRPQKSETPHARYGPTKLGQILSIYPSSYVHDTPIIPIGLLPFTGEAENKWLFETAKTIGGTGGDGGPGSQEGGEGGVGTGSYVPGALSGFFHAIFGGIGGAGGSGDVIGGRGGTGQASTLPEFLAYAGEKARSADPITLKDFEIGEELQNRLYELGFVTVGGLFEVPKHDLSQHLEVGDIATLKDNLEEFLYRNDL